MLKFAILTARAEIPFPPTTALQIVGEVDLNRQVIFCIFAVARVILILTVSLASDSQFQVPGTSAYKVKSLRLRRTLAEVI